MQRLTISLDDDLAESFDAVWASGGYQNRSEAMRDLIRSAVEGRRSQAQANGNCVASLSYIYNHDIRNLAHRLMEIMHAAHDLVISTNHVHLDHDTCLETVLLKGPTVEVRALADRLKAERGVRFGEINLISVVQNNEHDGAQAHTHHTKGHHSPHRG